MERQPFDPLMPYQMLTAFDARRLLRRSGMAKHEVAGLTLAALHDAIVERNAGGTRRMDEVVILNERAAERVAEESRRILAGLRPDLPQPYNGSVASLSGARETMGGLPDDMPIEKVERAVHAMFSQEVAVLTDDDFSELNQALNHIIATVPHGRARQEEESQ